MLIPMLAADLLSYNTRVPLIGTLLLGMCGGGVGSFMLLRKKALVGDVASHAALPGIGIAYLSVEAIQPGAGKSLHWLLIGASISAGLGVFFASLFQRSRFIKEDSALGIVLSLFFGTGVVLFTVIQQLKTGTAAGLNDFIFGKTAAMTKVDVYSIAVACAIVLIVCFALFKEFTILCFDEEYATAIGWPAKRLDFLLTSLVVGVTVIGMQSVGLLLVVALLIIPPTAARFWSDRVAPMVLVASLIGGLSAATGVLISASFKNMAAGPTIVLTGAIAFAGSLVFGTRHGTFWQYWQHRVSSQRKGELDLLRSCYEGIEQNLPPFEGTETEPVRGVLDLTPYPITLKSLVDARGWSNQRVLNLVRSAKKAGWLRQDSEGLYRLTQSGSRLAAQAVRNHRLWELYLIYFADVAPSRVDREADLIEHILEPGIIDQLEGLLEQDRRSKIPLNPHS